LGTVFLTINNKLYRSFDDGGTWHEFTPPNPMVRNITFLDADSRGQIYAGSRYTNLFITSNAGATWTIIDPGSLTGSIRFMAFGEDGEFFWYTYTRYLYKTHNGGATSRGVCTH